MLIKLLHIVAAIILAAAAVFAVLNRSAFKTARIEKNRINREEVRPTLTRIDETITEIENQIAGWRDATASNEQKQIALTAAQANFKAKTEDFANINKEITDKTAEVNKLEADLKLILGNLGSIDELTQTVDQMTQEIAALKTEAETLTKQLDTHTLEVKKKEGDVALLGRTAAARNKGINMNSLEATIVAVNPDYGFAVVNAGGNRGVTGDSKLIVKRGAQRVAVLNITSIEGTKTIADIIPDSLSPGLMVAPGDRVIIEKVQR
jgi:hypothetical protein